MHEDTVHGVTSHVKRMFFTQNNGENALHGGLKGLSKSLFSGTIDDTKENTVTMGYTSPDGEDGYPGSLTVNVTYSLDGEGGINIEYKVGRVLTILT